MGQAPAERVARAHPLPSSGPPCRCSWFHEAHASVPWLAHPRGTKHLLQHHLKGPWSVIPKGPTESPVVTTEAVTVEGKRDSHSLEDGACTGEARSQGFSAPTAVEEH